MVKDQSGPVKVLIDVKWVAIPLLIDFNSSKCMIPGGGDERVISIGNLDLILLRKKYVIHKSG